MQAHAKRFQTPFGGAIAVLRLWSFAAALITQPTEGGSDTARDPNAGRRECLQTELRKALAYDLNPE
jgi:hypothetical protein